jgi:arylsulfatase A-like enzyme
MALPATMNDKRENTPWTDWPWQIDATEIANMKLLEARYYQLVQEVDHHVGRILTTLDDLGLADNTLVIFISDHGEFLGDHGVTQKFLHYQEAIRIPMIMRLPGRIPKGCVVDHPVGSLDLTATIFDYAGLPCPPQEGHSLRPLIEGRRGDNPEYACSELASPYHVFVNRDWKYVWSREPNGMDMLYNLGADPHELNNLLGKNPDRAKWVPQAEKIRKAMQEWMRSINHPYVELLAKSQVG